jgi:succinoglycan biosynthesis protein ExoO
MTGASPGAGTERPKISVIMANYNGERFLLDAARSVFNQTISDLELIVSDDGSRDAGLALLRQHFGAEPRLVVLETGVNAGPAAARNRALRVARGDWIAIVDSDDMIHPERLERLLTLALADGADIVADDLLFFDSDAVARPSTLLTGRWSSQPFWVNPALFIRANEIFGRRLPALGYCKPVMRRTALGSETYNESLTNGEDYDLLRRLLVQGRRLRIYPELLYFYRRHIHSISHRITEAQCLAIERAEEQFRDGPARGPKPVVAASVRRQRSAEATRQFGRIVQALKQKSYLDAAMIALRYPRSALLLRYPVESALRKAVARARRRSKSKEPAKGICIISRQRIVGATNGSSVYLLSIASYLRRKGHRLHLLLPSPTTFGRWPYIRMSDEMKIFDTIRMRGAIRLGNFLIASNPARAAIAAASVIENALIRMGLYRDARTSPAPYAIAAELKRADQLYVSRNAPAVSEAVIFDYAFLTSTRPYVLRPAARTAVLMHDLFSARADLFSVSGVRDSTTALDFTTEKKLLCNADCIIAIQPAEAEMLRSGGASARIVVAPMAVAVVDEPQPGAADEILFIGSKAAPNVDGIGWFLGEVWPAVRTRLPRSRLRVVGSVCSALPPAPDGVEYLGLVDDLSEYYRRSAVIISPLRVGSGLKIKLIEAMGQGKAVVATSVTLQGVETLVQDAVRRADTRDEFVGQIEELCRDPGIRAELGRRALTIARECFSDESCYGSLEVFFRKDPADE